MGKIGLSREILRYFEGRKMEIQLYQHSWDAEGNGKWYSHSGKQFGSLKQTMKHATTTGPSD